MFLCRVLYLGPQYSRLQPQWYYYIFIPCDVISLVLQATGGAMSSNFTGSNKVGVNISLAGLCFQMTTLTVFCLLSFTYGMHWRKAQHLERRETRLPARFKIFVTCLALATILILVRCIYRIDELSDGYNGPLIHNEGLFIGLEGM